MLRRMDFDVRGDLFGEREEALFLRHAVEIDDSFEIARPANVPTANFSPLYSRRTCSSWNRGA